MPLRSALAGAVSTAAVLAALGNPAVVDAARDEGSLLATSITGFATWDVADAPGDVVGLVALRLGVTIVVAGVLGGLAGRSRSRLAAWLAGWGEVVVAAALGGVAGYVYQVAVVLDGSTFAATWADGLVGSANTGATFGLWTGWLVGVLVAVATRPAPATAAAAGPGVAWAAPVDPTGVAGGGTTPDGRRVTDPPPPWWAPTAGTTTDAAVRPGPTAFPPGGFGPVVPGAGEPVPPIPAPRPGTSHEMRTASGDPHPSDPDATQAVGVPPDAAVAGDGDPVAPDEPPAPTVPADDRTAVGDPDATATIEPPVPGDQTAEIPRKDP